MTFFFSALLVKTSSCMIESSFLCSSWQRFRFHDCYMYPCFIIDLGLDALGKIVLFKGRWGGGDDDRISTNS